jgi:hypothetical protein
VWESLDEGDRRLIEAAAAGEYATSLAEFNTNNALALRELRADGTVQIRRFDEPILRTLAEIGEQVVAEAGAGEGLAAAIHQSYLEFRTLVRGWSDFAECGYLTPSAIAGAESRRSVQWPAGLGRSTKRRPAVVRKQAWRNRRGENGFRPLRSTRK